MLTKSLFEKLMTMVALFYTFSNLFNIWLNKIKLDSHTASTFNLLQYVVLIEIYESDKQLEKGEFS